MRARGASGSDEEFSRILGYLADNFGPANSANLKVTDDHVWIKRPQAGIQGTNGGEWRTYGGDLGNRRYSPLDQITATNFNKLQLAWRFKTDNFGPRPEYRFESNAAYGGQHPLHNRWNRGARWLRLMLKPARCFGMHNEHEGARGEEAPPVNFRGVVGVLD